ncbi:hypothetical protein DL766_000149 [Monosporascus sp. MC13-8B]|uniref:Methyltransferase type 12 domain-containing protein n=1 Tax=Monosporascus cannonballus TaxID=155416 RepID=A0ABY0HBX4_9PEZI|nr:hypothetical protein DL762_004584 [Monosporascus cannonballus]RYO92221.1 hypothetical protein DL763_004751 [Monosporascus cannonballus]RYP39940.1 hypothetical protein DL766_000149 [Monosporascus sp. MC13-8B]
MLKNIKGQRLTKGSYDVIIASLVFHAARDLAQTLRNVRRLLKPGGYLLLLEITENDQMRFGLLFGGLQGWWLGYDDGRALSPCVGLEEWPTLLKLTGFSGIDTSVKFIGSLNVLRPNDLPIGGTVLCLTDIEEPVLRSMDPDKLRGFQKVFKQSTSVL